MKIKLIGDGTVPGTLVTCEKTGTPMAGAEISWIRSTATSLEVEIMVSRFVMEVSTHGTIPNLLVKNPPVVRPYFVVNLVGDGTFDFTKVVAHDTNEEISVSEVFLRIEEGQTKPKLMLVLKNPLCQFSSAPLTPPASQVALPAGFIPKGYVNTAGPSTTTNSGNSTASSAYGPGNTYVPGDPRPDPDPKDSGHDPSSDICKHEYVRVPLFSSTIEVCKLCKKEKK